MKDEKLEFCSQVAEPPEEIYGYMTQLYGEGEEQPPLDGEVPLAKADHLMWNGTKKHFLEFVESLPDDNTRYKALIREFK